MWHQVKLNSNAWHQPAGMGAGKSHVKMDCGSSVLWVEAIYQKPRAAFT